MPDSKISELPAATLPLTGTEQLPIVQNSETRRAPASAVGGRASPPFSAINSNGIKYVGNRNGYGSLGAQALSVGWVYLQAFAPASIEQVIGAGIEITTAGAGSVVIGLYDVTAGATGTRVALSGLIDVSATGFRTAAFSSPFTPNRTEYLLGIATSVQCTARGQSAINGLMPLSAGSNSGQLFLPRPWDGTLPATLDIGSPAGFRSLTNLAFLTA